MAIDDKHPAYTERLPDWELIADCDAGERTVKAAAQKYLPPTSGMVANGFGEYQPNGRPSLGQAAYDAYRMRAAYHDFVHETISGLQGIMHRKPPTFDNIPPLLEPMLKSATIEGESLETLWQRITEWQLGPGRCGLLVDVPDGKPIGKVTPYIALYGAQAIINWDTGQREQGLQKLELVVLDETDQERQDNLSWELVRQFRVLTFSENATAITGQDQSAAGEGTYVVAVAKDVGVGQAREVVAEDFVAPSIGGKKLDQVPFIFINTKDLVSRPDRPPMLGLANLSMTIYRGEADYRHALFMTGQDTLARIGATEAQAVAVGAGAVIDVPMGGDVKYVGVTGVGLAEQRSALENDKEQASAYSIQMLDATGGEEQSGEALRVRVSAKTANLTTMQNTAAAGIRDSLILAGTWLGIAREILEKIVVKPNLEFSDAKEPPETVSLVMTAKQAGLPLSNKSIHAWLVKNGYTVETFEEEQKLLDQERTDAIENGTAGLDLDPNAPAKPLPGKKPPPPGKPGARPPGRFGAAG